MACRPDASPTCGLVGDSIDNIPGVPGIGRKTAAILLHHFGGLEAVLDNIPAIAGMRLRGAARIAEALAERIDQVRLARQLTGLAHTAPVPDPADSYRPVAVAPDALLELVDELRFGAMTRRACLEWCEHGFSTPATAG